MLQCVVVLSCCSCKKGHALLCTTWVHVTRCAKRTLLPSGGFRSKNAIGRKFGRHSPLCSGILSASSKVVHRPRLDSSLHFDIGNICKFTRENIILVLGVCFPQPSSSAGYVLVASRSRLDCCRQIGSFRLSSALTAEDSPYITRPS